jgi:hypothetical protein
MSDVSVVICAHTLDRWDELSGAVGSVRTRPHAARRDIVVIAATQQTREKNQQP